MLEQLDLFSTFTDEQEHTSDQLLHPEERKLVPPQVILQETVEPDTPHPDRAVADKKVSGLFDLPETQPELFPVEPEPLSNLEEEEQAAAFLHSAQTGIFLEIKPEMPEKPKSGRGRKSSRDQSANGDQPVIPEDQELFSKPFYGIGEVAAMFKVNTSLLRYWESEFDLLAPRKNGKGESFYRPEDIKTLQQIHHLLRHKKLTIEAARSRLKNRDTSHHKQEVIRQLEQLRKFLQEMKADLLLS
jgi:DNA-binding transcriptional MerR regulator